MGRTALPAHRRAALPADPAGLRLLLVPALPEGEALRFEDLQAPAEHPLLGRSPRAGRRLTRSRRRGWARCCPLPPTRSAGSAARGTPSRSSRSPASSARRSDRGRLAAVPGPGAARRRAGPALLRPAGPGLGRRRRAAAPLAPRVRAGQGAPGPRTGVLHDAFFDPASAACCSRPSATAASWPCRRARLSGSPTSRSPDLSEPRADPRRARSLGVEQSHTSWCWLSDLILKGYRLPAPEPQPRAGGRALPHRGGALPQHPAGGRLRGAAPGGGLHLTVGPAAGLRAQPGGRLDLHPHSSSTWSSTWSARLEPDPGGDETTGLPRAPCP